MLRHNPQRFSDVLEGAKLFEERIFGFHELELYPHVIYNDNPFSADLIQYLDWWIADHRHALPNHIQNISFDEVSLLVLMSKSYRLVVWYLYLDDDTILGRGSLDLESDVYHTVTAFLAFQGFRLYERILEVLRGELGPLRSSISLSPGAKLAWERTGARWLPMEKRWLLQ